MSTDGVSPDEGSLVEAAAAGVHHEHAEAAAGVPVREHVTPSPIVHHHHPEDPNAGVVRARRGKHAVVAAVLAGAITLLGVVLLALAVSSQGGGNG
jgi:hypothetical protein